jgi:long-subunit acyl-CoA synthetase (AMP-forming)
VRHEVQVTSRVLAALHAAPGDLVAVSDGHRELSYGHLAAAVDAEADWLGQLRARRCAVFADNGAGWIVADLSLLRAGALNVPVPTWFTQGQIDHVLQDAGIELLLTDQPERIARHCQAFRHLGESPHSQLAVFRREQDVDAPLVPAGTAKVTYTSGSTGAPKGVCLSADAMESVAHSLASAIEVAAERHLCAMPLSTLLENIAGVYAPILLGASSTAPATRSLGISYGALDPSAFVTAVARTAPHSLIVPPELLRVLVVTARRGWKPPAQLRFIAVGGASVAQSLLDEAAALGLPAYQGYGLSECASVVCLNTPRAARPGSVGRVLPHAAARIDEQGQIVVRGAVMNGYLGHERPAAGEIATGDLGDIDADGYVYVRGRLKNMFITSMGRNVSPEWVEAELTCDPSIGQAIVCGEAQPWPIALIHPASAQATDRQIDRAVAAANERLPVYAQLRGWAPLPEPLTFSNGLLTANGRPRRDAVASRHASLIDALYRTALAS